MSRLGFRTDDEPDSVPAGASRMRLSDVGARLRAFRMGRGLTPEDVAARTDGAVVFELYPAGQLGQAREMNEGVQLGVLEGTVSPAAFIAGFNPAVSILDVPFVY